MHRRSILVLIPLFLALHPVNVYSQISYSLDSLSTTAPDTAVTLQSGTAGTSEIGANGTTANVTVLAVMSFEDYVDNNASNVDFWEDKGTHGNFSAQQNGPDLTYDTLTEENTGGGASGYRIQQGRTKLTSTTQDIPITEVNSLNRAFVLLTSYYAYGQKDTAPSSTTTSRINTDVGQFSLYLYNTSIIRAERSSAATDVWITWQLIECLNEEFYVYRGSQSYSGSTKTYTPSIGGTVNGSNSLAWVNGATNDQAKRKYVASAMFTAEVAAGLQNTLILKREQAQSSSGTVRWVVVEFDEDAIDSMQTGETTVTTQTEDSRQTVLISNVDISDSILLFQIRCDVTGLMQLSIAGSLDSATQISFYAHKTKNYVRYVRWYVIDFGDASGSRQSGQENYSANANWYDHDETLSQEIAKSRAISFVSLTQDGTGKAFPRPFPNAYVENTTDFNIWRSYYGQESWIEWQILELPYSAGDWWDGNYSYRKNINVTTGPNTPYRGYAGYTVQFAVDTALLVTAGKMQSSGNDLRIVYHNGSAFEELDRHIINMNTSSTKVRFQLQANISASSYDDNYYMYYGNPEAGTGPADYSKIYLWYDDALSNRESEYIQGRVDATAHGASWGNTIAWNSSGYYTFDTGDNFADSLRPTGLSERDIYVEYEEYQTGAYKIDMTSGPLVRWVGTGSGGLEDSSHWYYYEMADSAYQGGSYTSHDDITAYDRGSVVVSYGTLGTYPQQSWTRVALASWGINPTNLKAWYDPSPTEEESGSFGISGRFSGTHDSASDNEDAGQVGIWLQQDAGRFRNILIRRYVEPEPTTSLEGEESINFELDLEIQWTSADYDEDNEYLCIYTGGLASENLKVDVWTGSSWTTLISALQPNQWNNVSVSYYLTSPTFTIRFKGGNESNDTTQDNWNIEATLLNVWTNGSTYDYVLSVISQKSYDQNIRLSLYDYNNAERLANCTIWFYGNGTSVQIKILDGSINTSTGEWYNLTTFSQRYIVVYAEEFSSGTSILYIKLEAVKGNSIIYTCLIKLTVD